MSEELAVLVELVDRLEAWSAMLQELSNRLGTVASAQQALHDSLAVDSQRSMTQH